MHLQKLFGLAALNVLILGYRMIILKSYGYSVFRTVLSTRDLEKLMDKVSLHSSI